MFNVARLRNEGLILRKSVSNWWSICNIYFGNHVQAHNIEILVICRQSRGQWQRHKVLQSTFTNYNHQWMLWCRSSQLVYALPQKPYHLEAYSTMKDWTKGNVHICWLEQLYILICLRQKKWRSISFLDSGI